MPVLRLVDDRMDGDPRRHPVLHHDVAVLEHELGDLPVHARGLVEPVVEVHPRALGIPHDGLHLLLDAAVDPRPDHGAGDLAVAEPKAANLGEDGVVALHEAW